MDCIFCKIANKEAEAKVFFEDDQVLVIQDILPKAPVHLLVIPKAHIGSIATLTDAEQNMPGHMVIAAKKVAAEQGISDTGYKLIFNVGKHGGQLVPHLHLHVLGGKLLEGIT